MTQVFATARMYTGPAPSIDLDRVFGVTTFELGLTGALVTSDPFATRRTALFAPVPAA